MGNVSVFGIVSLTFLGTVFATLENLTGVLISWGLVVAIIVLSA